MPISSLFESCEELHDDRSGTPFDANGEREYTRRFRVRVTNTQAAKGLGPYGVTTCPGIPQAFSPYVSANGIEYDLLAVLTKGTAKQEHKDDWRNWIVDCFYTTKMPDHGPPEGTGPQNAAHHGAEMNNPELERPEIEWDMESVHRALPKDLDGRAFTNSAKQPFSPAPTFDIAYPVLVLTRNELNFSVKTATRYSYAVNSDVFLGQKPGTAQCMPPKAKQMYRGNLPFWKVSYRIRFGPSAPVQPANVIKGKAPLGFFDEAIAVLVDRLNDQLESWQPQFLDAGTMCRNPIPNPELHGKPTPIIKMGHPVTHPVLLDGVGNEQKPDANGEVKPVFLKFRVYPSRPFNALIQRGFVP